MTSSHEGRSSARLPCALGLLVWLAFTQACANDTGRPKGFDGPSVGGFGMAPVSTLPPMRAGSAGFGSPSMPTTPTTPTAGATAPGVSDCRRSSVDAARGLFSDACIGCLCAANPTATLSCGADCFALLSCVSSNCDPSDTNCIVAACASVVGGAANLAAVGVFARATPLDACPSVCGPPPSISDGGPDNDF